MEYREARTELYALASRGIEPGLDRMRAALERAAHPERAFPVIHVAGTNGKGSTSAMIATGLAAAGHRVGLYTSPHLAALPERMRILGEEVTRDDLASAYERVREHCGALTFFEAITLVALELFRARAIDVAVLEVGLGGRLDATNVVDAPLACAITKVGIDHQRFLGSDLRSIAAEKAGILKRGVPAVIAPQRPEALETIEREASTVGAPTIRVGRDIHVEDAIDITYGAHRIHATPRLRGAHQHENCAVAAGVLWSLSMSSDVRAAIETVEWPGRLETIGPFLLDGAHNPDGCEVLAAYLAEHPRPRVLVFGAMADKDWRAMLASLRPHVGAIVYAAPELARAEQPATFAAHEPGAIAKNIDEAIAIARAQGTEIVVAGSLYLTAAIRSRLLGIEQDPPIAM